MDLLKIAEKFDSWSEWKPILIACAIVILSFILRKVFAKYLLSFFKKTIDKHDNRYLNGIFNAMTKPTQGFIILLGFHIAFKQLNFGDGFEDFWSHLYRSIIVYLIALVFYTLSGKSSIVFEKLTNRLDVNIDKLLIPFMSKALHILVVVLAVSVIAQEWGFDVNGFVAGLGIGGLAIALAAKDSLSNLFASFLIIAEKSFSIGDWIETSKGGGIVEDITFRSTRIRTFEQSIVIIPNAILVNEYITNWSKMDKRKIAFDFTLPNTFTIIDIEEAIQSIKESILKHNGTHNEELVVHLDKIESNIPTLHIHFFTRDTEDSVYAKTKQDINFAILDIVNKKSILTDSTLPDNY